MKLRNKKTGEIGYFCFANWDDPVLIIMDRNGVQLAKYNSLSELNADWEDVPEEPKGWCVTMYGGISLITKDDEDFITDLKEIGNYFNDKESAYDALDKLKAWKRLNDKGFRIRRNNYNDGMMYLHIWNDTTDEPTPLDKNSETFKDLDLLFGGEE